MESVSQFTHLHVHSEFSLLDGAARISALVKRAKELGMSHLAITDHGVLHGAVDFYKTCKSAGIQPIIGCEVYTAARSMSDRDPRLDSDSGHLVLLAETNIGYQNLMKIVSAGFTNGFYYKPRIDQNLLKLHCQGIIALSACLAGDVPSALLRGEYKAALEIALRFESIMGRGNFFLELQHNELEEQLIVNEGLVKIAAETGIPLVATNDIHYIHRADARAQDILICIQTGKTVEDSDRLIINTDELYMKSQSEMAAHFSAYPEAITNTLLISERCNVQLAFGKLHLPAFPVVQPHTPNTLIEKLTWEGYKKRYGNSKEYVSRTEFELSVIKEMGYVDYFLIVWDFIRYAREKGIMVGPGRGSAAGSIVSYCLAITNVDPIKYNLIFERFLNPERISMPDIDIDFCYERRQEVIDYVVAKYGSDRVAQIITFGTMAARAAVRDVGRALAIPYGDVDRIAKLIPVMPGKQVTIEEAIGYRKELSQAYAEDPKIRELLDTAKTLEGMPRHASTHAAGIVIAGEPITNFVPLYRSNDLISTQFTMNTLEEIGLLKMDFLALRTLTVIRDALSFISNSTGVSINIDEISTEDTNVYALISRGETAGVFQLESQGMTSFMKELQPNSLEDIIAGISLYRPGPMDQIPRYIRSKANPGSVTYLHPDLEPILSVTYGCLVYQEQVMQIVRDIAGYSLGRSDLVRRAMSKKKKDAMNAERNTFVYGQVDENGNIIVHGAIRKGLDEKTANQLFDEMADFAAYAFNKSHAAAYAVIGFQTAWLKAYHPVAFMAALMNSFVGNLPKVSEYMIEVRKMSIHILPPDINSSFGHFSPDKNNIRFGLNAIKNVGALTVQAIVEERERGGLYKDFVSFCERMVGRDVNKKTVEHLIRCGAFDSFGVYRSRLMAKYEYVIDSVSQIRKNVLDGQISLFGQGVSLATASVEWPIIPEYDSRLMIAMEKDMLGLYLTGHPLDSVAELIEKFATSSSRDFQPQIPGETETSRVADGQRIVLAGVIADLRSISTRNNSMMAFMKIEDQFGQLEVIVFPKVLEKYAELIQKEGLIWVEGRASVKEDEEPKLLADTMFPLSSHTVPQFTVKKPLQASIEKSHNHNVSSVSGIAGNTNVKAVETAEKCIEYDIDLKKPYVDSTTRMKVRIPLDTLPLDRAAIFALLCYFEGNVPLHLYDKGSDAFTAKYFVDAGSVLYRSLVGLLGEKNVKMESIG